MITGLVNGIVFSLVMLAGVLWFMHKLRLQVRESKGRLDDELMPSLRAVVWVLWFIFSSAAISYSAGYSIPGLNALAGLIGASVAIAMSQKVKEGFTIVKLFFTRPVDIGQTVEYNGREWMVADIVKTDIILTNTKGDDWVLIVPLIEFSEKNPCIQGRWNKTTQRVK